MKTPAKSTSTKKTSTPESTDTLLDQEAPGNNAATESKGELTEAQIVEALTPEKRTNLEKLAKEVLECEEQNSTSATKSSATFAKQAEACRAMRKLLGNNYPAYMRQKCKIQKSHASRLALAGEVLKASPRGDADLFKSEAHARPVTGLEKDDFKAVMDRIRQWREWSPTLTVTPAWFTAAVQLQQKVPLPNTEPGELSKAMENVLKLFKDVKGSLPANLSDKASKSITMFEKEVQVMGRPSSTGIAWTEATWNPLHGCTYASEGCKFCYAAKLMATRMKHRYPGLAKMIERDGEKLYIFNNKILLDPKDLAEPLADHIPKRYFVNSMSDLFHDKVPEDFINAVFDVMEKAWWHQFQVLTKRPENMAKYSQKRYATKTPPTNIWLGTTAENQAAFDNRIEHLAATKTAVRWLSCEPLIGAIDLGKVKGVDWMVVGGESGSKRMMEAEWAMSLRDQCKKLGITFFFKQWGDHNEKGEYKKMKKDDFKVLPVLDKAVHGEYPMEIDLVAIKKKADQIAPPEIKKTAKTRITAGPKATMRAVIRSGPRAQLPAG